MITKLVKASVPRRRVHITGAPNSRKTTSLLTFPKPTFILSAPGEKGYATIPLDVDGIDSAIWQFDEGKADSDKIVSEVEAFALSIIAGGKYQSFSFDGFHKFFEYIADVVTGGAWFDGEEFKPALYGTMYRRANWFLDRCSLSAIPVLALTSWSGDKNDRKKKPGENSQDIPAHIMPDLPGQYAKDIMGEFDITVHQSLRKPEGWKSGDPLVAAWQTRPEGEVWGCSIKGPAKIVAEIPTFIPADYQYLDSLWTELENK